jgi:hypothetical protein
LKKMKRIAILAVLALAAAGCAGTGGDEGVAVNEGEGNVEQPATQSPEGEMPVEEPSSSDENADEPVEAPAEEEPAEEPGEPADDAAFVSAGEPKEIETTIEGMTETVSVTPYTIVAYGISYDLRTDMGAPEVDAGQRTVKYITQMGDDTAQIVVQVLENTTVNDAVAAMKDLMQSEGYGDEMPVEEIQDAYSIPFKMANYQGDGYFAGFKVFGFGDHSLVVRHRYPFEAGDGMSAVMREMLSSLTINE